MNWTTNAQSRSETPVCIGWFGGRDIIWISFKFLTKFGRGLEIGFFPCMEMSHLKVALAAEGGRGGGVSPPPSLLVMKKLYQSLMNKFSM